MQSNLRPYKYCRDAAQIDKTRLATLTNIGVSRSWLIFAAKVQFRGIFSQCTSLVGWSTARTGFRDKVLVALVVVAAAGSGAYLGT